VRPQAATISLSLSLSLALLCLADHHESAQRARRARRQNLLVRDGLFTLRGRLAWAHDSNTNRPATATFQSLPAATFTVNGAEPSADAALVTAGAEMKRKNGWSVAGTFEGKFPRTTESYAGKGNVRYAW
jgi:uncharacterized protein with beta-barrel porin domain